MTDERLDQLIAALSALGDGFANNVILKPELLDALKEIKAVREKPLHCPSCDGDHL
jgi:hypothetical protein